MKLSIIIPVYNVAKHLDRCIGSVIAQALDDYEILLIDDGSTDGSSDLCDEWQRRYPHIITTLHQANRGLSAARNTGLDKAQGEYVTFIDSDDELSPHTLPTNIAYLASHPDIDMLEYPIEVHADSPLAYRVTFDDETPAADIFTDWVQRQGYRHCYACNKIYRAALWHTVRFPMGEYFEDTAVMPHIIRHCRSIHYSGQGCYRYIMHEGSITTSYTYAKQRQLFINNYRLYQDIRDHVVLHAEASRLWIHCLNLLVDMGRCTDVDKSDHAIHIDHARQHRPSYAALLQAAPLSTRLKLLPLPLMGLHAYCRIYIALTRPLLP